MRAAEVVEHRVAAVEPGAFLQPPDDLVAVSRDQDAIEKRQHGDAQRREPGALAPPRRRPAVLRAGARTFSSQPRPPYLRPVCGADGGTRTHTSKAQGILSPRRLPFRHVRAAVEWHSFVLGANGRRATASPAETISPRSSGRAFPCRA